MTEMTPKFAIMGSGGIGGYFGACLARSGFDTSFIARGAHLEAIRQSGLQIEDQGETFRTDGKATDDPRNVGHVDFVLFAVKLWDVAEAGAACKPLVGPDTAVVSLLNGVESEGMLASILGAEISATSRTGSHQEDQSLRPYSIWRTRPQALTAGPGARRCALGSRH
jgi:2-dehydropantoate 2-reductase